MNKKTGAIIILILISIAVLLICPFIGMSSVAMSDEIFIKIRVPRVISGFLSGCGLALCGMVFQAVFRNPLATPYTLGVSSGASLGAAIAVTFIGSSAFGLPVIPLSAFAGALVSVFLVYEVSRIKKGFHPETMLLAGVAVSFFFGSLIMFIQYMSDYAQSYRIMHWLLGSIEVLGFDDVFKLLPFVVLGSATVFFYHRELDLLAMGEELAVSRGVESEKIRKILFAVTSLVVGGIVSVAGPIGFVGLMSPHICRLMIGPGHRYLAPSAILFGGAFLTVCDTFARTVIAPAELPVGVVTALLGGPFFLWLLVRK